MQIAVQASPLEAGSAVARARGPGCSAGSRGAGVCLHEGRASRRRPQNPTARGAAPARCAGPAAHRARSIASIAHRVELPAWAAASATPGWPLAICRTHSSAHRGPVADAAPGHPQLQVARTLRRLQRTRQVEERGCLTRVVLRLAAPCFRSRRHQRGGVERDGETVRAGQVAALRRRGGSSWPQSAATASPSGVPGVDQRREPLPGNVAVGP